MTDALDRIQARIRHDEGCQECNDLRDLIAERERMTTDLAAHIATRADARDTPPSDDAARAATDVIRGVIAEWLGMEEDDDLSIRIRRALASANLLRQGPVTEAEGRAAFLAFMGMDEADFAEMTPTYRAGSIAQGIAALEASRKVTP